MAWSDLTVAQREAAAKLDIRNEEEWAHCHLEVLLKRASSKRSRIDSDTVRSEASQLFAKYDTDGRGEVSIEDLVQGLKDSPEARAEMNLPDNVTSNFFIHPGQEIQPNRKITLECFECFCK